MATVSWRGYRLSPARGSYFPELALRLQTALVLVGHQLSASRGRGDPVISGRLDVELDFRWMAFSGGGRELSRGRSWEFNCRADFVLQG